MSVDGVLLQRALRTPQLRQASNSLGQDSWQPRNLCADDRLFFFRLYRVDVFCVDLHYMASVRGLNLKTSALYASFPFIAMTVGCLIGGRG